MECFYFFSFSFLFSTIASFYVIILIRYAVCRTPSKTSNTFNLFSWIFFPFFSEAQQSNAHLSHLIRAYRAPSKVKTTQSVDSTSVATAPAILSPIPVRYPRRMLAANRSKSPPKANRPTADASPKRLISNDNINTERLKLARDEAERAMKVS